MLYISTSCIDVKELQHCLRKLAEAGITHIELSGGMNYLPNVLGVLIEFKVKYNLSYILHNYFPPPKEHFVLNIASSDKYHRQKSIEFINKAIDLASEIGSDRYVVHAGYAAELCPPKKGDMFEVVSMENIDDGEAWDRMFSSLHKINAYGRQRRVKVGVENLFPFGQQNTSLLITYDEIKKYLETISGDNNLGMLIDYGHLAISANKCGFNRDDAVNYIYKNYSNKILGIHLSENYGTEDQHLPLTKDSWQLPAAKKFYKEQIPVTLESRHLNIQTVKTIYKMITSELSKE